MFHFTCLLDTDTVRPYTELSGPADVAIRQMADGSYMMVVPELMARDNTPGDDEVTVLAVPSSFDCR